MAVDDLRVGEDANAAHEALVDLPQPGVRRVEARGAALDENAPGDETAPVLGLAELLRGQLELVQVASTSRI